MKNNSTIIILSFLLFIFVWGFPVYKLPFWNPDWFWGPVLIKLSLLIFIFFWALMYILKSINIKNKKKKDYRIPKSLKKNKNLNHNYFNFITVFLKGEVDLPLAFWVYGFIGSNIVGFIFGWLSDYSKNFNYLFIIVMSGFLFGLWNCAATYKKKMIKRNRSTFWGIVVQIICILSAIAVLRILVIYN